jgi:hypothetical protein
MANDLSAAFRYRRITIETDEGFTVDILRDDSKDAKSEYYFLIGDLPRIQRFMRELGVSKIDFRVLRKMVREGLICENTH